MRWGSRGILACLLAAVVALSSQVSGAATPSDPIITIAGTGAQRDAGDGGPATAAAVDRPRSIALMPDGGYVLAQAFGHRVRRIAPDGTITTLAGTGVGGFRGDRGRAVDAELDFVHGASPLPDGSVLLADTRNARIRKVSPKGIITTVAGNGVGTFAGDGGPATRASIREPRGVTALPDGGFLIPDTDNSRVRRVDAAGTITTVAGTGETGFAGDGGPAVAAQLSSPFGVVPTPDGGLLIADTGNNRIRKVGPDGVITTVAGTGVAGFSGDGGPAAAAQIHSPHNVTALADGSFLIADTSNNRVRLVDAAGVVTTLAGTGEPAYGGDRGPAGAAQLWAPKAVAVGQGGTVLVADEQNSRVRLIGVLPAPRSTSRPTVTGTPVVGETLTATAGTWVGLLPSTAYEWRRCRAACTAIPGATASTYAVTPADVGARIRVAAVATSPSGTSASAISDAAGPIRPVPVPATNVRPPRVKGTAAAGRRVTAAPGIWRGTPPLAFSFRWLRCESERPACRPIPGATGRSHRLSAEDAASRVAVVVTAANDATPYAEVVRSARPLAFWRFDDLAAGSAADDLGTAGGKAVADARSVAPGLVPTERGRGAQLDGRTQYVEVPADVRWTPRALTLEILVRPSRVPDNRTIWAVQGDFRGWWLNTGPDGAVRLFTGDGVNWQRGPDGPILRPGETYHLTATYDGRRTRLYVDGRLVSLGPLAEMLPDRGSNPMRFGSFSAGAGQHWPGGLDDASLYLRVLGPRAVVRHCAAALDGSATASAVFPAGDRAAPTPRCGGRATR